MRSIAQYFVLAALPITALAGPPVLQDSADAVRLYGLTTRQAQYESLQGLPTADIEYGRYGRLRSITGRTGIIIADAAKYRAGDSAEAIFQTLKPMLLASDSDALIIRDVVHAFGMHTIFMEQMIAGIPVIDAEVNVQTTIDGEIKMVNSQFVPSGRAPREPKLPFEAARKILERFLLTDEMTKASNLSMADEGSLAFWTDGGNEEEPRLMWLIEASYTGPGGSKESARFGVDATTGEIRHAERLMVGLNRTTYTLGYTTNFPSALKLLWNEGYPNPADAKAYAAYLNAAKPRNAWARVGMQYESFGIAAHWGATTNRDSFYSFNTNPAYSWLIFSDFMATELDAVAHEYGHGVYRPRMGPAPWHWWDDYHPANEFYADLSAVMTDIYDRGGFASDTWKITSLTVRNLSYPKSVNSTYFEDWYPERRFYGLTSDVAYANTTIFGHALYLIVQGGYHSRKGAGALHGPIPAIYITPTNPELAHSIFAFALLNLDATNTPMSGLNLKAAAVSAASTLAGPTVANNVSNAFRAVGIGYGCSAPPPRPNPTITPLYCRGTHIIKWTRAAGDTSHGMVRGVEYSWNSSGQTVFDGTLNECHLNVPIRRMFRMRVCNGCGCSAWTDDVQLNYYSPCL